jgi:Tfp pilus assembly PilM family ATPase
MDGLPFTLARAVRLAYGRNGKTPIAAVNWGFTSGTFCVVSDGRPQFTRHLRSCGLGATIVSVSRALGLSEDAAMQLLTKHGLPNPKCQAGNGREIQEVIAEVAAQQLNEIADELKKTIAYLHKRSAAMLPQRLCLLGEGATMKNVPAFLSQKVGLPVEGWRLPHSGNGDCVDSKNRSELLGTAVALSTLAWES